MTYLIGNWKSNHSLRSALEFLEELKQLETADSYANQKIISVIAPPAVFLTEMQAKINNLNLNLTLAVQDLSAEAAGAHTGQIGTSNLAELGIKYALVGHSETRLECGQTHEAIAHKVDQALQAGLRPVLCIDEPYLEEQAKFIPMEQRTKCLVAFEPLSAIGTGKPFSPSDVKPVVAKIKELFGAVVPVLYGGSVNPDNIGQYTAICDGALVGSASLTAKSFYQLAKNG